MRTDLIELTPELFDQDLRIDAVLEPLHRQTLVTELAIKGLIGAVLPWFAWVDERCVDAGLLGEPTQHCPRYKLRAVV